MESSTPVKEKLRALGESIREDFVQNRRVMSFAEYLELVGSRPKQQLRSAAQYIRDCFDYFGSEEVARPYGPQRRFRLFDCPWADGRERLVGQEDVQNRIYRALNNFVNEGVSNKLVLLHGPNGSSKSTLVRCIGRAMQHYSTTDEGAVYRFNWIFPAQKVSRSGIGFSGAEYEVASDSDSYAYLPEEMIDAKVRDELRDHPLFLIPVARRRELLEEVLVGGDNGDFVLSDYLNFGRLSHKNRGIYEALLTSYQGDYAKVLRHVQVERFFVRHRYRTGYATVEPQLSVDATERQITADRSVAALPSALQTVPLFEYGGELVDSNRGLIEYSDLLKRPLEAYKYLLSTVEHASVSLSAATLFLDLCYIGTSNEVHLSAFKEIAEFQSFKGRLDLVRVPYLLDYRLEEQIYEDKLREAASSRHVAPHCAFVAALWAVLTRMRKPMADKYPKEVTELVARLTPVEKAELFATGRAPDSVTSSQAKELLSHLSDLWHESDTYPNYEGRTGASPREIQVAIFNAANADSFSYVSPMQILAEIEALTKQTSVYEFLKQEALPGGYHDHRKFIALVRRRYVDVVEEEVRTSLGLVEETEYHRLFDLYLTHVIHWTKSEKVRNPTTGAYEDPDEGMMRDVERTLDVTSKNDEFRHDLISRIGAWSIDHPGERPIYHELFSDHFKKLHESYYEQQKKAVKAGVSDLLAVLRGEGDSLGAEERDRADKAVERLCAEFGYVRESARDAVAQVARARYSD